MLVDKRTYQKIYGCVNHACGYCSAERLQEIECDGFKDAFSYEEMSTRYFQISQHYIRELMFCKI